VSNAAPAGADANLLSRRRRKPSTSPRQFPCRVSPGSPVMRRWAHSVPTALLFSIPAAEAAGCLPGTVSSSAAWAPSFGVLLRLDRTGGDPNQQVIKVRPLGGKAMPSLAGAISKPPCLAARPPGELVQRIDLVDHRASLGKRISTATGEHLRGMPQLIALLGENEANNATVPTPPRPRNDLERRCSSASRSRKAGPFDATVDVDERELPRSAIRWSRSFSSLAMVFSLIARSTSFESQPESALLGFDGHPGPRLEPFLLRAWQATPHGTGQTFEGPVPSSHICLRTFDKKGYC